MHAVAATVGALYDHGAAPGAFIHVTASPISSAAVLTFDSEVTYIWKKKWTPLKCLFLFNRYLGATMLLYVLLII